jgi:transcriptional regulator with XRE-family HTH domain
VAASELGDFLRARRDRLSPAQAGLDPFPGPRRVPGLRREELAVLAGVSADYLRRVEQGRQAHVSEGVLDALARALRLDEAERAHLHRLGAPRPSGGGGLDWAQRADPGLLRLLVALDHLPGLVLGRRGEVLARNALLTAVLGTPMPEGSSFVRWLLLAPEARERIVNWEAFASASVAALRGEAGRHPDDARLRALIDELRGADTEVAGWWDDHGVRDYASVRKVVAHPTAGRLEFDIESVSAPHEPDQRLVVYTAQPGSRTEELLGVVASWAPPTTRRA